MSSALFGAELARERARELHSAAARRRLARIAACCKPSFLAARLVMLRERLRVRPVQACCA